MSIYDTVTSLQNNTNQLNYARGQQNLGKSTLDKDAFTQLLFAKLQNQDPTNPVDDSQMLTQQAQLAQVEKLDNLVELLKSNNTLTQASTLVGKKVDITLPDKSVVTGIIDSATLSNTGTALNINGKTYGLNQVSKVYGGVS